MSMILSDANISHPRKVAIIGPECTGKTDLSHRLAAYFKTEWVPEYARQYLNKLNRPYERSDLTKIAHGQVRMEDEWAREAKRVLICDTNLTVIKVWSEFKYGERDPEIIQVMKNRHYDLLLVTDIDIPWEDDPQREHPDKREHFRDVYITEAQESGIPFAIIEGTREQRLKKAVEEIEKILSGS